MNGGGGTKKHLSDLVQKIVSIAVALRRAPNNVVFPGRSTFFGIPSSDGHCFLPLPFYYPPDNFLWTSKKEKKITTTRKLKETRLADCTMLFGVPKELDFRRELVGFFL